MEFPSGTINTWQAGIQLGVRAGQINKKINQGLIGAAKTKKGYEVCQECIWRIVSARKRTGGPRTWYDWNAAKECPCHNMTSKVTETAAV